MMIILLACCCYLAAVATAFKKDALNWDDVNRLASKGRKLSFSSLDSAVQALKIEPFYETLGTEVEGSVQALQTEDTTCREEGQAALLCFGNENDLQECLQCVLDTGIEGTAGTCASLGSQICEATSESVCPACGSCGEEVANALLCLSSEGACPPVSCSDPALPGPEDDPCQEEAAAAVGCFESREDYQGCVDCVGEVEVTTEAISCESITEDVCAATTETACFPCGSCGELVTDLAVCIVSEDACPTASCPPPQEEPEEPVAPPPPPVEAPPADPPVEAPPADPPVEAPPADPPVEAPPADPPVEAPPVDPPADEPEKPEGPEEPEEPADPPADTGPGGPRKINARTANTIPLR